MLYDKKEIRDLLTEEQIFELLNEWGGDPEYTDGGIISATICHNAPGEGSRKLYYYFNSKLFHCYTGCAEPSFDIFQLTIKVANIQFNRIYDLNDAVRYIAYRFGIIGTFEAEETAANAEDWKILDNYNRIQEIEFKNLNIQLKEYDSNILNRLNYKVSIYPWLKEGISQEAINHAHIGFYPGGDQITIPHYDIDGRFIGLRGRALCAEDAERYGKYRPIIINKQLYNHPLGMNLYNLNNSKKNIKLMGKVIIFESEKSTLLYQSYFGIENDISVACCGSSLSAYQVQALIDAGAKEIIVAFDRQFKEINDDEFKRLTNKLIKLHNKFKNYVLISFIFDKNMITGYKDAPIDCGPEIFLKLFKERVIL